MKEQRAHPDQSRLDATGIEVWDGFFPKNLLHRIARRSIAMPDRKAMYRIKEGEHFPPPIGEAAALITATFYLDPRQINTAILKRYELGEPSGAFDLHRDPEELQGGLFIVSLSGGATLETAATIWRPRTPVECIPNRLIAMPSDNWHKVSEPDPQQGVRGMLFLGHSCPSPDRYPHEVPLNWWVD